MKGKKTRFSQVVIVAALMLGIIGGAAAVSGHGVGVATGRVAYADGCDDPHPSPWLDCPEPTATSTATSTPPSGQ